MEPDEELPPDLPPLPAACFKTAARTSLSGLMRHDLSEPERMLRFAGQAGHPGTGLLQEARRVLFLTLAEEQALHPDELVEIDRHPRRITDYGINPAPRTKCSVVPLLFHTVLYLGGREHLKAVEAPAYRARFEIGTMPGGKLICLQRVHGCLSPFNFSF
jgi:hypothetical protein